MSFFFGLDLGQAQDYSALALLEMIQAPKPETGPRPPAELHVRALDRFPLCTPYPEVVAVVGHRLAQLPGRTFIIDRTGVGRGVFDSFVAAGLRPIGVTITAGDEAHRDETGAWKVPKRDLVAAVQVPLQNKRLKVAPSLPLARVLRSELDSFKMKLSDAIGTDTYGAWRSGTHDDIVLACALAAWYALYAPRPTPASLAMGRASGWVVDGNGPGYDLGAAFGIARNRRRMP